MEPRSFVDGSSMSMIEATHTLKLRWSISPNFSVIHKPASCHKTEDHSLCLCRVIKLSTVTQLMIQDVVIIRHQYYWEVREGSVTSYSARARKVWEISHFRHPGTWSLQFCWHATQRWSDAVYRRSGKLSKDLFISFECLNLEEGTDTFSWKVGKQLPNDAV